MSIPKKGMHMVVLSTSTQKLPSRRSGLMWHGVWSFKRGDIRRAQEAGVKQSDVEFMGIGEQ
jgi:hypothetical protein